jgi:hypothetical protein
MNQTERAVLTALLSSLLAPKLAAVGVALPPEVQAQLVAGIATAGVVIYHAAAKYLETKLPQPKEPQK